MKYVASFAGYVQNNEGEFTVGEKSIAPPPIFDTPNSYLLYNKLDENILKIIKILHGCTPIYSALIYVIYFI